MPSRLRRAADLGLIEDGVAPSREGAENAHAQTQRIDPEVEAFARWFADWWLWRRGVERAGSHRREAA
jgi:hypothetical protein